MSYTAAHPLAGSFGPGFRSGAGRGPARFGPAARLAGLAMAARALSTHAEERHGGPIGRDAWCASAEQRGDTEEEGSSRGRHWSGHGRGGFGGPGRGFPFAPPWVTGGGPFGGGPKARRGDVRAAILSVLADGPRNGYQLIGEIAERSGGAWKPSPGSIYPTLAQLEDEGLVAPTQSGGRKAFELTAAGREYVTTNPEEISAPWEAFADSGEADAAREGFGAFKQLAAATFQVLHHGDDPQRAAAAKVLADARRDLYQILAENSAETASEPVSESVSDSPQVTPTDDTPQDSAS